MEIELRADMSYREALWCRWGALGEGNRFHFQSTSEPTRGKCPGLAHISGFVVSEKCGRPMPWKAWHWHASHGLGAF